MSNSPAPRSPRDLRAPGRPEEGKGGKEGPSNAEFLAALFPDLPEGAQPLVCTKSGDPSQGGWFARAASAPCPAGNNNYYNISSFTALSAKKDAFAAFHVIGLDDIGTKVPWEALPDVKPTYVLETSPGNHQVGFRLTIPIKDRDQAEDALKLILGAGLGDKGAAGVARWMRLPVAINGKAAYRDESGKPFQCKLTVWNPDVSYEIEHLVSQLAPGHVTNGRPLTAPKRRQTATINPEVFKPALLENPAVTRLKEEGHHKADLGDGKHDITCPWVGEHTSGEDSGTCFFEPSARYPMGGFVCHHGHCSERHLSHLLDKLDLTGRDVRNRPCIRTVPGELPAQVEAAEMVLAETGEFFHLNGKIVRIVRDRDGNFAIRDQADPELTLALANLCDWEYLKDGSWQRGNPHKETLRLLGQLERYQHLPPLKSMAWQPVLDEKGTLLFEAGYDAASQLFLAFDPDAYDLPEPTRENALEAKAALDALLVEFHFATAHAKATAYAGMFTATLRPGLGQCPAFHVKAPAPGSGKSYFCEIIAQFASPSPPAKPSYPTRDEEASKVMLAVLLGAPSVIEFDDMGTDWISFGAINRMLTSSTITERVLGASATATCSTDVLVLGSGNNTGPRDDLLRRVCVIELDTREETPATIQYRGNPLAAITSNRERYIGHVLTIVRAWQAAGEPQAALPSIATYNGKWTRFCRQPLVWLGMEDPALGLIEQLKNDESRPVLGNLLAAWYKRFRDRPVMIRELRDEMDGKLGQAIDDLPFMQGMPFNPSKMGWYLKRNANRPVNGLRLEKAAHSERTAWRVVALPPSTHPSAEDI